MNRLHIVGGKSHGKTTLIVELVKEFAQRGVSIGTIKHTHHHHELDVPGKDSFRHRMSGARAAGIMSPSITAIFLPTDAASLENDDRYSIFAPMFAQCRLVLLEGDSHTAAPKIEVWRSERGTPPMATCDKSIVAVVTDDAVSVSAIVLSRSDISGLSNWIRSNILSFSSDGERRQFSEVSRAD